MSYTYAGQYGPQLMTALGLAAATKTLISQSVHVYQVGTTTAVTLYTDRTKGTTDTNPVSADANGNLTFFADPGQYDIVFTPTGGTQQRLTVSVPLDNSDVSNIVNHGAAASTARPPVTVPVWWFGTVAPSNAQTNDVWWDESTDEPKRWTGSAWIGAGSQSYPARLGGTSTTAATLPWVNVADYGAVGDGTTDDSAAIQAACNALGSRGGWVRLGPHKHRILSNLNVPPGVRLSGQGSAPGDEPYTWDETARGTVLLVASGATVSMDYNTSLTDMRIIRDGWSAPATQAAATSAVAAFAGNAITINGSDVNLENLVIIGFTWAIYHNGAPANAYERPYIRRVWFDCTNGIRIGNSADLGYISFCRGYPFTTANRGFTSATDRRSGVAFQSDSGHDWGTWAHCNSYGYNTGYKVTDSNNVRLIDCGADSDGTDTASNGILPSGTCQDLALLGFRAAAQNVGIHVDSAGSVRILGASAWGCGRHVYITGTANVDIDSNHWWYLSTTAITAVHPVEVASSATGKVTGRANTFEDNATPTYPGGLAYTVAAAVLANFHAGSEDTYINCVAGVNNWRTYTPAVSGTGWALGNGTATARYAKIGHDVLVVEVAITFGSTSTFGTGNLTVSLPAAGGAGFVNTTPRGNALFFHSASGVYAYGVCDMANDANDLAFRAYNVSGAFIILANVTNTVPFTWAASDALQFQAVLELG